MYDVKKLAKKLSIKQSMLAFIIDIGTSTLSAYANGKAAQSTVEKVDKAIESRFNFDGYLNDVSVKRADGGSSEGIEVVTGIPVAKRNDNVVEMNNGAIVHFVQANGMLSSKSYRYSLKDVKAKVGDKVLVQVTDGVQFAVVVGFCTINKPSSDTYIRAIVRDNDVAA